MNKLSAVVIAFLIGIIAYQNGALDNFFHKGIKCDSQEAQNLGAKIIKDKLLPRLFNMYGNLFNYDVENISFKNIITRQYNKETGFHQCYAYANITLKITPSKTNVIRKKKIEENGVNLLKILAGAKKVNQISSNEFQAQIPVKYTTEITDDKKHFYEKLQFDVSQNDLLNNLLDIKQ